MLCFRKSLADVLPVGDLPDCLHVVGTDILILQVVGVFPDVYTEEWNQSGCWLERVLVGAGRDLDIFLL